MSAIAESESLLRRVVPDDQGFSEDKKYAGIFHFRFWFGRWIEIVVDDRIPVRKGLPIYMRSSSNVELWPTLLEKAYAKAKGSYELLNHWLPGVVNKAVFLRNIFFQAHVVYIEVKCQLL